MLKHEKITETIIGTFYDVYNEVGYGFLESVYETCMVIALKEAGWQAAAQLLHYLKATRMEVGLLLNFGERPQFKRLFFDNSRKEICENPCESVAAFSGVPR